MHTPARLRTGRRLPVQPSSLSRRLDDRGRRRRAVRPGEVAKGPRAGEALNVFLVRFGAYVVIGLSMCVLHCISAHDCG